MAEGADDAKARALEEYKRKLLQHKELDSKVRGLREEVKTHKVEYEKTEDDLKALQSVGQIIGEVLRQLDDERCEFCQAKQPAAQSAQTVLLLQCVSCSHLSALCCSSPPPLPSCPGHPPFAPQSSSSPAAARVTWSAVAARWTRTSCCPTRASAWTSQR